MGGWGHWLRHNVGNISVLNHEGEPMESFLVESRQCLKHIRKCVKCVNVILLSILCLFYSDPRAAS